MIDAKRIHEIIEDSLFEKEEDATPENTVIGEGVMMRLGMNKEKLEKHREEIKGFLQEVSPQFHKQTGGGWSFLNLCMDKDGVHWGEHRDCDALVAAGSALGYVTTPMKEMASILPGGMPYVCIDLNAN